MTTSKKAALIGTTGLIGGYLLRQLEQDAQYGSIRLLVRRPFEVVASKTEVKVLDFADATAFRNALKSTDVIFCTIGTTQQKVGGDKEAYRKVDFDIAVNAARYGQEAGCRHLVLVSSVGASTKAGNFYLQLKGEIEEAVKAVGLPAVSIFQPSMLLGDRKERRIGERIGQVAMSTFSFLIPSNYKPIAAAEVAAAMAQAGKQDVAGVKVYQYSGIKKLLE
jgi:uncharacterized protein YbjT (DUF2867 family)